MKILYVTNSFNLGGAETHILELSLLLKSEGHDITIASSGGIYELDLKRNDIKHVALPLDDNKLSCMIESYIGLKKLILNEKFDIVHAHARIPALICEMLKNKYDFKFVTTCHYNFKNTKIKKALTRWGEHVFSISEDIDNYLMQLYNIPKRSITRVINGINTSKFIRKTPFNELLNRYELKGKRVIYTTTRLEKGTSEFIDNCIKSIVSLSYTYPDLVYIISGGGEKLDYYKEVANEINARFSCNKIIITGPVYNVNDYLNLSNIFIGPSRSALEAISSEIPTIVSGSQGHIGLFYEKNKNRCIETNFCGRGDKIADDKVYYSEIENILNMNNNELEKIKKYGRDFIVNNYSCKIMAKQYMDKYKELLSINKESSAVICGYYGCNNFGDEIMLASIIDNIRIKNPSINFSVITSDVKDTKLKFDCNVISKYDLKKIEEEIKKTHCLIFGGGNIFQDKTSFRSLKYYDYIANIALKNNAEIFVISNGIGPIKYQKSSDIVKNIIEKSSYISIRDLDSYNYVLGYKEENVYRTKDISLLFKEFNTSDVIQGIEPYFIVCPKKDCDVKKLSNVITYIKEKYEKDCVIIPLHNKEDMDCARQIAKLSNSILFDICDIDLIENVISKAYLTISMRLHGCIISEYNCVPTIGDSSIEKIKSYITELYGNDDYICDLSSDENVVFDCIDKAISQYDTLHNYLEKCLVEDKEIVTNDIDRIIERIKNSY